MLALRLQTLGRVVRNYPLRLPAIVLDGRSLDRALAHVSQAPTGHDAPPLDMTTRTAGPLRLASHHDLTELREVLVSNMYCAAGFVPRPGWTVVDVGANLGFFAAWALSLMPHGRLIAIEPVPETFGMLRQNLQRPGRRTVVRLVCGAVGAGRDTIEMVVPQGPEGWSGAIGGSCWTRSFCAAAVQAAGATRTTQVPTVPLDEMLGEALGSPHRRRVDLLKIDVEGMEAECLEGAPATLAQTDRVVFEYHGYDQLSRCTRLLTYSGFREVLRRTPYSKEIALSFWSR